MYCETCLRDAATRNSLITKGPDNSRHEVDGELIRKNLMVTRLHPDAPAAFVQAVVKAHLGDAVPVQSDLTSDDYIMGPRDYTFEVIRILVESVEEGSVPTAYRIEDEAANLWRAVGDPARAVLIREIILDSLEQL